MRDIIPQSIPPPTDTEASRILENPALLKVLIHHAKKRDRKSFETLHSIYGRLIWSRLRPSVSSREEAEDLYQETFLHAWKALPDTEDNLNFKAWLCKIAANLLIDDYRRKKRVIFSSLVETEQEESVISGSYSGAEAEIDIINTLTVDEILDRLPPRFEFAYSCLIGGTIRNVKLLRC